MLLNRRYFVDLIDLNQHISNKLFRVGEFELRTDIINRSNFEHTLSVPDQQMKLLEHSIASLILIDIGLRLVPFDNATSETIPLVINARLT